MSDNKIVQILLRVTKEEKGYITEKAKSRNISVNQFIKNCIFDEQENKDSNTGGSDIGNDITRDIISDFKWAVASKRWTDQKLTNDHL